jgi:hypothetical protein
MYNKKSGANTIPKKSSSPSLLKNDEQQEDFGMNVYI